MKASFQNLSQPEKEKILCTYFTTTSLKRFATKFLLVLSKETIQAFATLLVRQKAVYELPEINTDRLMRQATEYAAACHVISKVISQQCSTAGKIIEPGLWPTIFHYYICHNNPEKFADFNKNMIVY